MIPGYVVLEKIELQGEEKTVILAKEVRDRFTLLQVLWDTGLLDEYAKMIAAYFGEKANC